MGKRKHSEDPGETEPGNDEQRDKAAGRGHPEGIDETNIVDNRRQRKPTFKVKAMGEFPHSSSHGAR